MFTFCSITKTVVPCSLMGWMMSKASSTFLVALRGLPHGLLRDLESIKRCSL
jgi:hypothetical protein